MITTDKGTAISRAIEELEHYLLTKLGVNGIPLAYLIRADAVPPAEADDQQYGQPSFKEELVRRARHGNYQAYIADNEFLWGVIRRMCAEPSPAWAWVAAMKVSRDGRAAYFSLRTHYLGPAFRNRIKTEADKTLETLHYVGDKRNFTLENFCAKLKQAFTILADNNEPVPEDKKIRIFVKGMQAPKLESAVNTILAAPDMMGTVERAMDYVTTVDNSMKSFLPDPRNISQYETEDGGDRDNLARSYSPDEWAKMSRKDRQKVFEARKKKREKEEEEEQDLVDEEAVDEDPDSESTKAKHKKQKKDN